MVVATPQQVIQNAWVNTEGSNSQGPKSKYICQRSNVQIRYQRFKYKRGHIKGSNVKIKSESKSDQILCKEERENKS